MSEKANKLLHDLMIGIDNGYNVFNKEKELKAVKNHIKEIEEQNKEMFKLIIFRCKQLKKLGWDEGFLKSNKDEFDFYANIIEKITGKTIEEVLKDDK